MQYKSMWIFAAGLVGVIVLLFYLQSPPATPGSGPAMASVIVPELSVAEKAGEEKYNANCAACHGVNGAGQEGVAPPFMHRIYAPNHHADGAFFAAVQNGVRAHHWTFGDMPAMPGVSQRDVAEIVTYIRALQRANNI